MVFAAGAAAAVPIVATAAWHRESHRIREQVARHAIADDEPVTADRIAAAPAIVRQFLARSVRDGQPAVTTARITQRGEFQLNGRWCTMKARQLFSATPPGFIWDARIYAAPLMPVYVRDSYVLGRASMRASMLGIYSLVNQAGAPALNSGALLRYLGEAAWFPTRLLPGAGLSWEGIDDRAARATLTDADTTVSLEFRFDEDGHLIELYSPDRFREVNGEYVPTPWRVRALGQQVVDGVPLMTPSVAEWVLPSGPLPYWRGRITRIRYSR